MNGMKWVVLVFSLLVLGNFVFADAGAQVTSYNVDPSPVIPGEYFTLYAYVTNAQSVSASNIQFTIKLEQEGTGTAFPFSLDPTDTPTRELGTILPFQTVQVKYRVQVDKDALDGAYHIRLEAGEKGKSGGILTASVSVASRHPVLTIVNSSPQQAQVGQTINLVLSVKNTGNSAADDVTVGLSEDRTVTAGGTVIERNIVPLGASSSYIPQIAPGETVQVSLPILINPGATSKAYFVPVAFEFYDSAKTKITGSDSIGLKVSSDPILDAYVSNTVPLPVPGQKSKITIDIYNSGLGRSKFTSATVSSDFFTPVQTQYFIGTIESDDFDSIVLDGVVSPSIQLGAHPIMVSVQYKNEFGDMQTIQKVVNVRVYSPSEVMQESGASSPFPLYAGILVVAGLVYWFRFRKPVNGNGKR